MSTAAERLDPDCVPALGPGVGELLTQLTAADLSVADAVSVLELHPTIAVRLVGLANSAWSAPVCEVNDLAGACARLGLNVVKSAAIAYAVASPFFVRRCPSFEARRFWLCALLRAEAVGSLCGEDQADAARLAALAYQLGLLWLADALPGETDAALRENSAHPQMPVADDLRRHAGICQFEATRRLLQAWQLSDSLQEACNPLSAAPAALMLRQAHRLAETCYQDLELADHTVVGQGGLSAQVAASALATLQAARPRLEGLAQNFAA